MPLPAAVGSATQKVVGLPARSGQLPEQDSVQKPRPPVWVPGGASVETWDLCLDKDFLYANLSYFGYLEAKKIMDGFWNAVDRHKLDRNPYRAGFLQFIAVADSDAEAERLVEHAGVLEAVGDDGEMVGADGWHRGIRVVAGRPRPYANGLRHLRVALFAARKPP